MFFEFRAGAVYVGNGPCCDLFKRVCECFVYQCGAVADIGYDPHLLGDSADVGVTLVIGVIGGNAWYALDIRHL